MTNLKRFKTSYMEATEPYERGNASLLQPPDQSLCPVALRVPIRRRELERTESGGLVMSEQNLRQICQIEGLYEFPQMNNKIYLHYKVVERIAGLEKYVGLKTLYLENNVITRIEGVAHLAELQNLFLQNNMIKRIENLDGLKELRVLNLSNNNIFFVEGLAGLPKLQSLTLNKNFLALFSSLEQLGQCSQTVTSIDLSDNKIEANEQLFDLLPQVRCLYLSGNPLVREIGHYRRTVVGRLTNLLYLDQRAVDQQQRIMAEAWVREGDSGFRKAREDVLALRRKRRQEHRAETMKDIDVHRKNKINVFQRNIGEFEEEITKIRGYMRDPANESQLFFYESRVAELMQKIRQNQQFIDSIYKRMGIEPLPPVYTLRLDDPTVEPLPQPANDMFEIRQDEEESEAGSEPGSEPSQGRQSSNKESGASQEVSETSSSQQSSVKTYYSSMDQLD